MSFSPEPTSPTISEKLTNAKIKKLSSLILRSEHPRPTDAVIAPLLELVSEVKLSRIKSAGSREREYRICKAFCGLYVPVNYLQSLYVLPIKKQLAPYDVY